MTQKTQSFDEEILVMEAENRAYADYAGGVGNLSDNPYEAGSLQFNAYQRRMGRYLNDELDRTARAARLGV